MMRESKAIIEAYAAKGVEACTAPAGGFFLAGSGYRSLRVARKDTGVNMGTTRRTVRISAYGDYATIQFLNMRGKD